MRAASIGRMAQPDRHAVQPTPALKAPGAQRRSCGQGAAGGLHDAHASARQS